MPAGPSGFMCPTIGRLFCAKVAAPSDPAVLDVALAIYHGGKTDSLAGLEAVAHVIQNRTSDPAFADNPRSVVSGCTEQFVDTKQTLPLPRNATEKRLFGLARQMATQLVHSPRRLTFPDTTGGALYYDRSSPARRHSIVRPASMGQLPVQSESHSSSDSPHRSRASSEDCSVEMSEGEWPCSGRFIPPVAASEPVQPSRGRRPLAFFRERRAMAPTPSSGSGAVASSCMDLSGAPVRQPRQQRSNYPMSPRTPPMPAPTAHIAGGAATQPPTPPPPSPLPHFPSFPLSSLGTAGNTAPRQRATPRAMVPRGGMTTSQPALGRRPASLASVGPADADGYHDMVLPCGLFQDEVIELMYRDLSPEDFEMLCKLDELMPKKNTAQKSVVDRLPRALAKDCGATECRVCLAEFEPYAQVVVLPCQHAFHKACISKWLTQCKNTCPLCFTPIQLQGSASTPVIGNSRAAHSTLRNV